MYVTCCSTLFYTSQLSGIVFCVDSSDRSSIDEARVTLEVMLLRSDLKRLPLLVYANKQDLEGCMSPREVEDVLQLSNIKDRPYRELMED